MPDDDDEDEEDEEVADRNSIIKILLCLYCKSYAVTSLREVIVIFTV